MSVELRMLALARTETSTTTKRWCW